MTLFGVGKALGIVTFAGILSGENAITATGISVSSKKLRWPQGQS
jgi:hypothetical protein